jgi:hypothetical protein
MTHDHRSAGSLSALAVWAAWARARLRFRPRHNEAAVSATVVGGEAADRPTEVSGPASHQGTGARPRRYADAVAMIDLRATEPSGIANAIVVACREVPGGGRQRTRRRSRAADGDPIGVGMRGHRRTRGLPAVGRRLSPACGRLVTGGAGGRLEAVCPEPASFRCRRSVMSAKGEPIDRP